MLKSYYKKEITALLTGRNTPVIFFLKFRSYIQIGKKGRKTIYGIPSSDLSHEAHSCETFRNWNHEVEGILSADYQK